MDYKKTYENLINKAKNTVREGKTEKHHIVPRAFGGSDDSENLVALTHREHYLAHLLLYKMQVDKRERYQMATALTMMGGRGEMKSNSRVYEKAKEEFSKRHSERMSGELHPMYGTHRSGADNPFYGKTHSDETKAMLSELQKGKVQAIDTRTNEKVKITKEDFDKYDYYVGTTSGFVVSEETKKKISATLKSLVVKRGVCVHCNREMSLSNLGRYHNDNCKLKPPSDTL